MNENEEIRPSGDTPSDEAIGRLVRGALEAAPVVQDTPTDVRAASAWESIQQRRGAAGAVGDVRHRTATVLSVAAALVVLVAFAAVLAKPDRSLDLHAGTGIGTTSVTTSTIDEIPGTALTVPPVVTPGTEVTPPVTEPFPPGVRSIRSIDFANFTYPAKICPSEFTPVSPTLTMVNGKAEYRSPTDPPNGPPTRGAEFKKVAYGDLNGDGGDDAVVAYTCYALQSDGFSDSFAIFLGFNDATILMATQIGSGMVGTGSITSVTDDRSPVSIQTGRLTLETIMDVSITAHVISVRWSEGLVGPVFDEGMRRLVTVTYGLRGDQLVRQGESDVSWVPRTNDDPPSSAALHKIRGVDLRNATVQRTNAAQTAGNAALCANSFGTTQFDNVTFVAGHGTMVDRNGARVDGSIDIEDIRYFDVTHDGIEEAVVVLSCNEPGATVRGLGIFAPTDGTGVRNLWAVSPSPPTANLVEVQNHTERPDPLSLVWEAAADVGVPGHQQQIMSYVWDGSALQNGTLTTRTAP